MKRILLTLTVALPLWAADVVHTPKPTKTTLVFDDGKEFDEVDINVLKISQTLNNMFDDLGSGTEEQIPITNISFKLFNQVLYPLMQIIHTHSDDSVMAQLINDVLQTLNFNQTKDLLIATNWLDIPQLLPLVVDQFAGLIVSDSVLKRFIEQPNFIQSLGIPNELLNMVAQQLQKTVEMRILLFKVIDPEPKKTISTTATSLALSPDGKTLASASDDNTIKVWDAATGTLLRSLAGHIAQVSSVAFSPDGKTLASPSIDETVKIWDVATGRLLRTLTGGTGWVISAAFSPDGKTLTSGSINGTVTIWDVTTGRLLHTLTGHTGAVFSVAFSSDGKILASGAGNKTINLWNVATGTLLHTLTGHAGQVFSVAFSPDGKTLASASVDNTIKLWDVANSRLLHTLTGHTGTVFSVAFSPDGKTLASASGDSTINLWDVATGTLLHTLTGHIGIISSVAFSSDGKTLASSCEKDNTIKLWPATFDRLSLEILLLIVLASKNPDSMKQENMQKNITLSLATVKDPKIKANLKKYFDDAGAASDTDVRSDANNAYAQ